MSLFRCASASRKLSNAEVKKKVTTALEQVELGGYEERMATQLSGGQQQRLALARALGARAAGACCWTSRLSNLDAKLRERMRFELRELQRRLRITTLYVTHDQIEALSMSNMIAVMNAGVIVQEGAPRDIYLAAEEQVCRQLYRFDQSDDRPGHQGRERWHGRGSHRRRRDLTARILDGLTVGQQCGRRGSAGEHQSAPAKASRRAPILSKARSARRCFSANISTAPSSSARMFCRPTSVTLLQVRRGDPVWVELPAGECMALPAEQ